MDRVLRAISWRRATLDAEEAHWLREAEALQIWRPLGMVSAIDYMERAMGYAPRTAQERLRVARALGALPELTEALAAGRLHYSAVRELTRVATPGTEVDWRDAALGKNLRQIEDLVAEHRPGDRPDDPPDPEARMRVVRLELSASTFALLRQARQTLDEEHGSHLSDDELVAALCDSVLDGAPGAEPSGRAKFQIAVTLCERCGQGWQDGAGARIAIDDAAVDRALCDAQHVGSLEADTPARAAQDVAPSVARLVWRRDHGRCRVPGCRSARGLEIHHIVHREDGGSHDAANLALVCSACHLAHHEGRLTISGTADHFEVRRPDVHFAATLTAHAHEISTRFAHGQSVAVNAQADVISSADATRTRPADANAIAIADATATARAGAIADAKPHAHAGATAVVKPHAHAGAASPSTYADLVSTGSTHGPSITARNAQADVISTRPADADTIIAPNAHAGTIAVAKPYAHAGTIAVAKPYAHADTVAVAKPHAHADAASSPCAHIDAITAAHADANSTHCARADALSTRLADADAIAIAAAHAGTIADAKLHAHAGATSTHCAHMDAIIAAHADANNTSCAHMDATSTRCAHADATTAPQAHAPGAHVGAPANPSAPMREPTRLQLAVLRLQAKQALTSLGWKPAIAAAAVAAAPVLAGDELSLERLIRAALRQCPKPRA